MGQEAPTVVDFFSAAGAVLKQEMRKPRTASVNADESNLPELLDMINPL
jgi:hypothetical protein